MEYYPLENKIVSKKILSKLDEFVIDFVKLLDDYVLVSGYVSIITGRSRATENVDLLVPSMSFEKFEVLWKKIEMNGFECINTSNIKEAFNMLKEHTIRFAYKGKAVPNMEFKLIKNKIHQYSFDNKIKFILGEYEFFISPLEMQIAYKLSLGSNKDLEDAKHIYELFKDKINKEELIKIIKDFDAEEKFEIIK